MIRKKTKSTIVAALTASIMSVAMLPASATEVIDVDFGVLEFNNPGAGPLPDGFDPLIDDADTEDIGYEALVDQSFAYEDVYPGVDALVTVVSESNLGGDHVDKVDEGQSRWGYDLEQEIEADDVPIWAEINPSEGGGSATLRVEFFLAGTETPVTLENIAITTQDVDDGQSIEFVSPSRYFLSSEPATDLTVEVSEANYKFLSTVNDGSADTEEDHWVIVHYNSADSVTFTVANLEDDDAQFGVRFGTSTWAVPPVEVVLEEAQPPVTPTAPEAPAPTLAKTGSEAVSSSLVIGLLALTASVAGAVVLFARKTLLAGSRQRR